MNPEIIYKPVNRGFRSKGFEWPPNKYQLLITINILVSTALCLFSVYRFTEKESKVLFSVPFFTNFAIIVYYWIRASAADPTDPVVLSNRKAIRENLPFESSRYDNMCTVCNTSVGSDSKHCGNCNRCVERFDHHCIWLNNCIGYNNYHNFIKLIVFLFIFEVIILGVSAQNIQKFNIQRNMRKVKDLVLAVSLYLLIQAAVLIIFLVNLIVLHIWLYYKGITTYEFIKSRNRKKENGKVAHDAGNTKGSAE
jgi:palmitoyltransferase